MLRKGTAWTTSPRESPFSPAPTCGMNGRKPTDRWTHTHTPLWSPRQMCGCVYSCEHRGWPFLSDLFSWGALSQFAGQVFRKLAEGHLLFCQDCWYCLLFYWLLFTKSYFETTPTFLLLKGPRQTPTPELKFAGGERLSKNYSA